MHIIGALRMLTVSKLRIDTYADADLDTVEMEYIVQVIRRKTLAKDDSEEDAIIMQHVIKTPDNADVMMGILEMVSTVLVDDGMITVTDDMVVDALLMQCASKEVMAKTCANAKMDSLAMDSLAEDHVSMCIGVVALEMHNVFKMVPVGNVNARDHILEMDSIVLEEKQNLSATEDMVVLAM